MMDEKYIITSEQLGSELFAGFTAQNICELKLHKLSIELKKDRKRILKKALNAICEIPEDPYCHAGRSEMTGKGKCIKILKFMRDEL